MRLKHKEDFTASYPAVKRLCRKLKRAQGVKPEDVAIPVEVAPGERAQVDFGYVGRLYDPQRVRMRKAWVFVMVLCHSRHMFARIVFDQKVGTWLHAHTLAFEHFGAVVRVVVPDNLKSAVVRSAFAVDGPTALNRSYRELARHYDFKIDPAPPYSPEKKGRVESGVKYVKNNFFKPRNLYDYLEAQEELKEWVVEIAGQREHGTTGRKPVEMFDNEERKIARGEPRSGEGKKTDAKRGESDARNSSASLRRELLRVGRRQGWGMAIMAEPLDIQAANLYRWIARDEASPDAPKAPLGRPSTVAAAARMAIRCKYREKYGQWTPGILAEWVKREEIGDWCATTIEGIIADLVDEDDTKAPPPVRCELTAANVMWSEDGTGFKERGCEKELLTAHIDEAMQDLNYERPRPVLKDNTAWEVYQRDRYPLPERRAFMEEVRQTEHHFITLASSRDEEETARRRAVEAVLLNHELLEIAGSVSTELAAGAVT